MHVRNNGRRQLRANCLRGSPAKRLFGGAVPVDDGAMTIDADKSVMRRFENGARMFLAHAQLGFNIDPLRHFKAEFIDDAFEFGGTQRNACLQAVVEALQHQLRFLFILNVFDHRNEIGRRLIRGAN